MGIVEFEEALSAMCGGDVARAIKVSGLVIGRLAISANFEKQAEAINRVLEEERSRARDGGWEVSAAAPKQSCEQL
jgi:hypothetical protein